MRYRSHILASGLLALVAATTSVAACSDDTTATPDSGTVPTGTVPPTNTVPTTVPTDAAPPPVDATPDAAPAVPVVAESEGLVPGALNPYGLLWASDGNLYMSGAKLVGGDRQLAVWRIDKTTNKVDTTFGTDGAVTVPIDGDETSYGLVELADGSFVVQAAAGGKVWLAKLTKTGTTYTFGTPQALVLGWQDSEFADWPVTNDAGVRQTPQYQSWGIALDKSNAAAEKIVVFAFGAPAKVALGGTQRVDNDRWIARVLASDFSHDPAFNAGNWGCSAGARWVYRAGIAWKLFQFRICTSRMMPSYSGMVGNTPGGMSATWFIQYWFSSWTRRWNSGIRAGISSGLNTV